jgi:hypothetical protein
MLLIVSYPTLKEIKRAAALGNPEALRQLEGIERAQREAGPSHR